MSESNLAKVSQPDVPQRAVERDLVLITHANPEDNLVARWLASRLSLLGYRIWVDIENLRGGKDFWNEIERTLREKACKQVVIVSQHIRKQGVKKELALGDVIGRQLEDDAFMIPVRVDDVSFSDLPPELIRCNTLSGFPNWAAMLNPLLETLSEAGVPRHNAPQVDLIEQIVAAHEVGRRTIDEEPEELLSNWFPLTALPTGLRFFGPKASRDQFEAWLGLSTAPLIGYQGIAGTFCVEDSFKASAPNCPALDERFFIPTNQLLDRRGTIDPFYDSAITQRNLVNLIRQHWERRMRLAGLLPFEFASGQQGWFFPDGLIDGSVKAVAPNGAKIDRVLTGKFKERRWHLCLVARPRLWPKPLIRVHANIVLTEDGKTPLPGKTTQKLRRRLTRSWFNDKWRDMLIAAMSWLSDGAETIDLSAGQEDFELSSRPVALNIDVSYNATEQRKSEENTVGEIVLGEELDTTFDGDLEPKENEDD